MNVIVLCIAGLAFAAPPAAPAGDATAGKALFAAKCATCHAKDGKGSAGMAKMYKIDQSKLDLLTAECRKLTAEQLQKVVLDGKEKMKGFKDKLTAEELANVTAYVLSLGDAAAPAKPQTAPK